MRLEEVQGIGSGQRATLATFSPIEHPTLHVRAGDRALLDACLCGVVTHPRHPQSAGIGPPPESWGEAKRALERLLSLGLIVADWTSRGGSVDLTSAGRAALMKLRAPAREALCLLAAGRRLPRRLAQFGRFLEDIDLVRPIYVTDEGTGTWRYQVTAAGRVALELPEREPAEDTAP